MLVLEEFIVKKMDILHGKMSNVNFLFAMIVEIQPLELFLLQF